MAENTEIHGKNTENGTIYTEIKVHRLEALQCLWLKNLFSYLSFVDIKLYSNSNVNDMYTAW